MGLRLLSEHIHEKDFQGCLTMYLKIIYIIHDLRMQA